MTLFRRAAISEILSHAGVVFSTILVIWLSVLMVRLLGEAASGSVGADVVLGLAAFSSITALPIILSVSLFIAVLATVTRSYRESEMVVWFASGLSLRDWLGPVLRCAVPVAVLVGLLALFGSPWAYRQIGEYRQRYEQRSDLSKVTTGQFIDTARGSRVFFAEEPREEGDEMGQIVARVIDEPWTSIIVADSARIQVEDNGDRFLVLNDGHRYDLKPGSAEFRLIDFDRYGFRIESRGAESPDTVRARVEGQIKARSTSQLFEDGTSLAWSQIMWRLALPIAAFNLALLAVPLGAVNPRLGRSGDFLLAGLLALLYMNLINLMRGWIANEQLSFGVGVWLVHVLFGALTAALLWHRMRVRTSRRARRSVAVSDTAR